MKRVFVYEYLSGGGLLAGAGTSGGALMAMGRAMRDAIATDLLLLKDYDVSVAAGDLRLTVPEPAQAVAPRQGESAFDFVARQADAHHWVWVVAPESGGLLSQFQRRIDPARWLGCDAPSTAVAAGKRSTLACLANVGVSTPLAFEHAPEVTRWVVKPDDGAGAVDTRVHASQEAALANATRRSRRGGAWVIEPWVEGEALSLSLMFNAGRCELLSINRQHLLIDAEGVLSYEGVDVNVVPPSDPRAATLAAWAARIGHSVPGLQGFVGIDLVWHAQRGPVAIEINPRVTCAYVGLSRALGRNLAADVIAAQGHRVSRDA
jgi:predicted ATP-grasp superfamily ATP-dependent carboligase